eukprot:3029984-Rhodomonas_salina.1
MYHSCGASGGWGAWQTQGTPAEDVATKLTQEEQLGHVKVAESGVYLHNVKAVKSEVVHEV